jgi:hypothetical protein
VPDRPRCCGGKVERKQSRAVLFIACEKLIRWSAGRCRDWAAYRSEPIVAVGFVAARQGKKFVL